MTKRYSNGISQKTARYRALHNLLILTVVVDARRLLQQEPEFDYANAHLARRKPRTPLSPACNQDRD